MTDLERILTDLMINFERRADSVLLDTDYGKGKRIAYLNSADHVREILAREGERQDSLN